MSYDDCSCIRIWQKATWANDFSLVSIIDINRKFPIEKNQLGCAYVVPLSKTQFDSAHFNEHSFVLFFFHPSGSILSWIMEVYHGCIHANVVFNAKVHLIVV
jgi:hypothetical protein